VKLAKVPSACQGDRKSDKSM